MGKTGKRVIGIIAALVVVIGIALYYLAANLDRLVAAAIERAGTDVTGVEVSVAGVEIDLREGAGAINGLEIGNPAGFDTDHSVRIGRTSIDIDLDATSGDLIVLQSVRVEDSSVNYEQRGPQNNLQTLLDQMNRRAGDGRDGDAGDESATKLIIDRFNFTGAEVTASIPALNKSRTVRVPDVSLYDIGRKTQGATAREVARQVLEPVMRESVNAVAGADIEGLKEEAKETVREKATEKLNEFLGGD